MRHPVIECDGEDLACEVLDAIAETNQDRRPRSLNVRSGAQVLAIFSQCGFALVGVGTNLADLLAQLLDPQRLDLIRCACAVRRRLPLQRVSDPRQDLRSVRLRPRGATRERPVWSLGPAGNRSLVPADCARKFFQRAKAVRGRRLLVCHQRNCRGCATLRRKEKSGISTRCDPHGGRRLGGT